MLKIIRQDLPHLDFIKIKSGSILEANCDHFIYKNRKLGLQHSLCLSTTNNIYAVSNYHRQNNLRIEYNGKNSPLTNYYSLILRPKQISVVRQRRNFSFQSSVQSFAASQSGIFKTISESTPVEYCQKFLLCVHDFTGLPWWASIILSTILIRSAVTLPLAVYQQTIVARLENLKLELPEIAQELKRETAYAIRLYNWDEKTARATYNRSIRKQWNELIVRDNCHPLKTTVLLWFQIPLWVSFSVSLRNLVYMLPVTDFNAQLTFTELMVGGFAFIPNLTIPDSSWIFPVTLGILNLAIVEIQVLSKDPSVLGSKLQTFLTNTFRTISVLMIPIAASVPSCLVLYWTTSSAYGLAQNLILMSPKMKRLFRIPETVVEVKQPYKLIVNNLKHKLKIA